MQTAGAEGVTQREGEGSTTTAGNNTATADVAMSVVPGPPGGPAVVADPQPVPDFERNCCQRCCRCCCAGKDDCTCWNDNFRKLFVVICLLVIPIWFIGYSSAVFSHSGALDCGAYQANQTVCESAPPDQLCKWKPGKGRDNYHCFASTDLYENLVIAGFSIQWGMLFAEGLTLCIVHSVKKGEPPAIISYLSVLGVSTYSLFLAAALNGGSAYYGTDILPSGINAFSAVLAAIGLLFRLEGLRRTLVKCRNMPPDSDCCCPCE